MGETRPDEMRGLIWSHLLASIVGGAAVAGLLLAFGVVGKQRTETVPINEGTAPITSSPSPSGAADVYIDRSPGVLQVTGRVSVPTTTPFSGSERPGTSTLGSGFLISPKGYVLTAYHLIAGAGGSRNIDVTFDAGVTRHASVYSYDAAEDVAVLRVPMQGIAARISRLPLGNSLNVRAGDQAFAIANPDGRDRTLSAGVIAAIQRLLPVPGGTSIDEAILTDMRADPPPRAASGSPLLDRGGSVIGLVTQLAGHGRATGFAVPIDAVRRLIPAGVLPR